MGFLFWSGATDSNDNARWALAAWNPKGGLGKSNFDLLARESPLTRTI
ncbi:MAG TPA: hypothetical protein VLG13_02210 [Patescibacteria group bacterium]|nr:hypothetical protein [Patescibacteria group bacterium]